VRRGRRRTTGSFPSGTSSRRCCSSRTAIHGELYDIPIADIRTDFLPEEPAELELTVIELDDGRSVLAVGLRPGLSESMGEQLADITDHGGWRRYRGLPDPDETAGPS